MSVAIIKNLASQRQRPRDRHTFRWRCWVDGVLTDVVIEPRANDEKNVTRGGVPGRIYERVGGSLQTVSGVVHQDNNGKVYFVANP